MAYYKDMLGYTKMPVKQWSTVQEQKKDETPLQLSLERTNPWEKKNIDEG